MKNNEPAALSIVMSDVGGAREAITRAVKILSEGGSVRFAVKGDATAASALIRAQCKGYLRRIKIISDDA